MIEMDQDGIERRDFLAEFSQRAGLNGGVILIERHENTMILEHSVEDSSGDSQLWKHCDGSRNAAQSCALPTELPRPDCSIEQT